MQKHNKNIIRSHHVRVGAIAIAVATGLHIGGAGHIKQSNKRIDESINRAHSHYNDLERENETARHMVRFDEGLRLPTTSGGEA
jgi:hypothetical protein